MKFTRGFSGRAHAERDPRLPPGQYDTGHSWPVLTAEVTPKLDTASWTFAIEGLVETPTTWTWDEIHALPPSGYDGDIHCVTTWSKLGMQWSGVSIDTPSNSIPSFDHVVTQWMSPLYADGGSACISSHVHVVGCSTWPSTVKVHVAGSISGVSSAARTGHWSPASY